MDSSETVSPWGIVKDLHACSAGLFKILKKLNAYVIDLFKDFGINFTFNIEDLVDYKGPDFNFSNPLVNVPSFEPFYESFSLHPLPNNHPNIAEKIDKILDDEIISNRDGVSQR